MKLFAAHAAWTPDAEWSAGLVAPFPTSWARRLLDKWADERRTKGRTPGNLAHLLRVQAIAAAHRAGVPADASDATVCQVAGQLARDMETRLMQRGVIERDTPACAKWGATVGELAALLEAWHWLDLRGLGDVAARWRGPVVGLLRRVVCTRWWRRVLRRLHAQAVEGTARAMGLVHKRAGCYCSDEAARRRAAQLARNAATLERVHAENEHGQRATLADLAAKGTGNRAIRRMELMTRIAGFEVIAKDCGHLAYFVTVTCPARMHAWRTVPGRVWDTQANPTFDGTTPDAAQRHLTTQWARFRAAADRAGLGLYGFRIAEPNHDGTPHWHALLFFPPDANGRQAGRVLVRLLRRYFWRQVDPDERGARRHRVQIERIDWTRGTAAGYVAKYVAKNIDGYKVEKDLYGNDCLTASQRVDAWASTWRVRQFQQVGGAPVGVWRELRRMNPDQAAAAPGLGLALDAVNVSKRDEAAAHEAVRQYGAAQGWASYTEMQGGARVRRAALRLRLVRDEVDGLGRYGDALPARVVGVSTIAAHEPGALGIVPGRAMRRTVLVQAESERAAWRIVGAGTAPAVAPQAQGCAERAAPWSPVNNCTRAIDAARVMNAAGLLSQAADPLFPPVVRVPKLGRWHNWQKAPPDPGRRAPAATEATA